jgi:hypothetical protein
MEITAKTKIADLLAAYPGLEEQIMNIAPPFKNLTNPVLRRTVGKLADLEKAAQIGGMQVLSLVNTLRAAVGQSELQSGTETVKVSLENVPAWITTEPTFIIDGVEMLSQGVHPLNKVNELMQSIPAGAYLVLYTNFKPLPLIEAMEKQNYLVHHKTDSKDVQKHLTFIGKTLK